MIKLVTHPRSGTHWILQTIFTNFKTQCKNYWQLFGGHRTDVDIHKRYPKTFVVHASRDIERVLMSVFMMRERNGLKIDDFSEFLRTPYNHMLHYPRSSRCQIIYNGKKDFLIYTGISKDIIKQITDQQYLVEQPCISWFQQREMTPPQLWLFANRFWKQYAHLTITYEAMLENQAAVLKSISDLVGRPLRANTKITTPIGWVPPNKKELLLSNEDKKLLDQFRQTEQNV